MRSERLSTIVKIDEKLDIRVQVSESTTDQAWDDFVLNTPGGHHVQTSAWARVKATMGWKMSRIIACKDGAIFGGAQVLIRSFPILGSVAYVTKGPLCFENDWAVAEIVLEKILKVCQEKRCQLIAIQPPNNGMYLIEMLKVYHFCESTLELAPTASLIFDLNKSEEQLFKEVHRSHRKSIRHALREDITISVGNQSSLELFYLLYKATAKRQGFIPFERSYFDSLWKNLHPYGWISLMLASYQGEAVSGQMMVPFRDTVIVKMVGWSGKYPTHHLNEALLWKSILWSKEHGYRYCDFEGLDPSSARAIINGIIPPLVKDYFKYAFGGKGILYPSAFDFVPNKVLNWAYRHMPPSMEGKSILGRAVEILRKR
ncbi:MAG: peptidoglycan bridge formation glycyltransferase FemA/FemB family protein [Anaerolineaceae bacterium]|nr:peptidoglycan bridge formation glycyltransferase FemA/FemB family protein [Anaerolineaceae bacterium]